MDETRTKELGMKIETGRIDPDELEYREDDQNRIEEVENRFPNGDYPPITVIKDIFDDFIIIDGHNRARVASDNLDEIDYVAIDEDSYDNLIAAGYDDIEISYAILMIASSVDSAHSLNLQFPGARVSERGTEIINMM